MSLSDGRRGRAIRPSCAEPLLHLLDAPTRQLDKRLRRYILWLCSWSSRPKMLASEEAGLDAASLRDLRSVTDLALRATKATAQAIGRSMSSQLGTPPMDHEYGDERGRQCSLPLRSGLVMQPVWTSCGGLCGMLHGGSEVVSSDATLPPQMHQLFCCFQSP